MGWIFVLKTKLSKLWFLEVLQTKITCSVPAYPSHVGLAQNIQSWLVVSIQELNVNNAHLEPVVKPTQVDCVAGQAGWTRVIGFGDRWMVVWLIIRLWFNRGREAFRFDQEFLGSTGLIFLTERRNGWIGTACGIVVFFVEWNYD